MAYVLYAANTWYGDAADVKPNATTYAGHILVEKDTGKFYVAYGGAWVLKSVESTTADMVKSTYDPNADGVIAAAQLDSAMATDAEVTTAVSNHAGAADPHTGYRLESVAVPNADLATMVQKTYKGRTTASTGVPEDVAVATLKTDLALVKADVGLGSVDNVQQQPLDADLTALAGLVGVQGDILYRDATQWQRLPKGSASQLLRQNVGLTAPEWATIAGGGDVVADDVSATVQNIVAYNAVGGKNITELTGTQGDVLYHDGTSWVKLPKGTANQRLSMNAGATAPEWQTVAGGGWTTVVKTEDESRTNNTLLDDATLVFTTLANTQYVIRLVVHMLTNATADSKYRMAHAGTTTRVRRRIVRTATNDIPAEVASLAAFDAADVVLSTTGTLPFVEEHIVLQVGASGGVLSFKWAQNTTNAGAMTVLEGSYLEYATS